MMQHVTESINSDVQHQKHFSLVYINRDSFLNIAFHWSAPMQGFLKVNVNNASIGNPGASGIGIHISDSMGQNGALQAKAVHMGINRCNFALLDFS